VQVVANDAVVGFKQLDGGAIEVQTKSGKTFPADIVILAIGVKPEVTLAKSAGLKVGERGGIRVDEHMRTSDPDIFAVGDAIEVKDFGTGAWSLVALAGPANRQGRIAADVICGRDSRYRGTQGTAIIGLFGGAAAWTGVSEKTLKKLGDHDYERIYLFPNSHAGYYPGATALGLKVLFRKSNGKVLGAQALGEDGPAVDKRISALAMAIQMGRRSSAVRRTRSTSPAWSPRTSCEATCRSLTGNRWTAPFFWTCASRWNCPSKACRVRPTFRCRKSARVWGSARLGELPRDREIQVICRSAQRAYYATRVLLQNGFKAKNISGGMLSRAMRGIAESK
jgi:hypothetical protein